MTLLAIDTGNTAWLLAASALVLLMAPGLALFYGGLVRSKSVLNMMMMTFGSLAVIAILWVLVGYSIAFGDDLGLGLVGDPTQYAGLGDLMSEESNGDSGIPLILFAVFQGLFCVITGALVSGAIADRARFGAWMVFVGDLDARRLRARSRTGSSTSRPATTSAAGWPTRSGSIDFAGGTAVEICSGASALALALVLGPRVGFGRDSMRPHNLTLVMLGAGLLWFGWFGFNAGSALGANQTAAVVFTTTLLAGAGGSLGWLLLERLRYGHATSLGAASGLVAGLVAITPSCGSLSPVGAIAMGLVAGVVCALAVGMKYRFGYDDSLDVVGVHLVGGLVGTFGIGLIATAAAPAGVDGLFYGGGVDQLGRQLLGGGVVLVYAFVVSGIIGFVVHKTMGFRIDEEHEVSGIDLVLHAETAYDLHGTSSPPAREDSDHEARHRGREAAQVGGRPGGPRGGRHHRHDGQRGQRLRPAEGPHRGLPRRRVRHRAGAQGPDRDRRRRRRRRGRGRRDHPQRADRPDRRRQGVGADASSPRPGPHRRPRRRCSLRIRVTAAERAERTAAADALCVSAWESVSGPDVGAALVAVGGYGRSELAPYSDLDLVLVHDEQPGLRPR